MSKYHSTISRRTFMKALGFGAGAAAAATAAAPIFNDLDELTASAPKTDKPWWVKERDFNNPKNDIDWNVFDVLDQRKYPMVQINQVDVQDKAYNYIKEGCEKKIPGRTTRDLALTRGIAGRDTLMVDMNYAWNGVKPMGVPLAAGTTSVWGTWMPPKWESTPEDNFQTLRAALHSFGADNIGAIELDEKSRKLLYWYMHYDSTTTDGYITAQNGSAAVENDGNNQIYLPTSAKYIITWSMHQNYLSTRNLLSKGDFNGGLGYNNPLGFGTYRGYHECIRVEYYLIRFIQTLGYKVFTQMNRNVALRNGSQASNISPPNNVNIPFGIFAGLGELSRSAMLMTPTSGTMQRMHSVLITDMPLAPTPPIDFGGIEFCRDCKRCAEVCRGEAISMERNGSMSNDSSNAQRPGYYAWRLNWTGCKNGGGNTDCGNCQVVCPFNHPNDGLIHKTVRLTTAKTTLFNGFFANIDRVMQYAGPYSDKELDNWWYRDYKSYKGDTILAAGTFNWNL
ncbi:MAG: reductive dehalogenase [Chloroflexi bacterium]|nr:reductive dehalogenase [Chloroflexota bacterium]